jgi:hypothetical protein
MSTAWIILSCQTVNGRICSNFPIQSSIYPFLSGCYLATRYDPVIVHTREDVSQLAPAEKVPAQYVTLPRVTKKVEALHSFNLTLSSSSQLLYHSHIMSAPKVIHPEIAYAERCSADDEEKVNFKNTIQSPARPCVFAISVLHTFQIPKAQSQSP